MTKQTTWRTPLVILVGGGIILTLAMGVRHTGGLFLQPMTAGHGWSRETFSFAFALQNLISAAVITTGSRFSSKSGRCGEGSCARRA